MNARSIKPKTAPFSEYVTSKKLDIVAVTETWLKHDETKSTTADISPPGYSFFHEPRADQRARCPSGQSDVETTLNQRETITLKQRLILV